ncbi:MAG: MFS transporter [Alphaproteobacteria bacterium]|nr:MFS transporter [Alphaproteobacteria bacterium]
MHDMRAQGSQLVLIMSLAQAAGMLGFGVFPALLPGFIEQWSLSESQAGWLNGIFFAGYMVSVPLLVSLTDRHDARVVFLFASALSLAAMVGFALLAQDFWSALVLRALHGVGFAGAYMPGLKVLTDRLDDRNPSRAVAFYTASYSIGAGLSFYLAGVIDAALGWPWAFALLAAGSAIAFVLVVLSTAPQAPIPEDGTRLLDFRPILRNRRALAYMLAYALHTGELMAIGTWLVAFLSFSAALQADGAAGWSITAVAAVATVIALPASLLGNEGAIRFGRRRMVGVLMVCCAMLGCLTGFSATWPFWIVVALCLTYGAAQASDSASLTAGTVMSAEPGRRGATMAVHSFVGFGGGFLGPVVFGGALDLAGGRDQPFAWSMAFAAVALPTALGPLILRRLARPTAK